MHLTQELEQLVRSRANRGPAIDVVRDDLMEHRKREIAEKIAQGLNSLQRGEGVDGEEFFAQLEREEAALESIPAV